MDRLSRTWNLFEQSFVVLSREEGILLFPVFSAISAVLLAISFIVPLYEVGTFHALARHNAGWQDYLPLFSWYYANTFVVVFFNGALVACANIRLSGGDPTVMDGLRIACRRIHRIAAWSLAAATVGLILRAIEERSERAGKIVSALMGCAWTMATCLIVPVIVLEDRGVAGSLSRSVQLFRKTWGEQMAGGFAFGMIHFLLMLPAFGVGLLLTRVSVPLAVIVVAVYLLMLAAVTSAVRGIFTVALYRYATSGDIPYGFSAEALGGPRHAIDNATGNG